MIHRPITITNLALSFSNTLCFEGFSATIAPGTRIALIGRNGSGKSSLLALLCGTLTPTSGTIHVLDEVRYGYVPQLNHSERLSGGQAFNAALTEALRCKPNVLLLDEPTNHLDSKNRASLMRMLRSFPGTVILVSHDTELLRSCIDTIWHIDNNHVQVFLGQYDDYIRERACKRRQLEAERSRLCRKKQELHRTRMKTQQRAAKSRATGKKKIAQGRWMPSVAHSYASNAEKSTGKTDVALRNAHKQVRDKLSVLHAPETIVPTFSLEAHPAGERVIVSVQEGNAGYGSTLLLRDIHLSVTATDRIALLGENGSGKSTLLKALLHDNTIERSGQWQVPDKQHIGYLDQRYATLCEDETVLETITEIVPNWSHADIRCHLNDFLFRTNQEVNAPVAQLSGGQRARLCLAQIAAKTPRLLLLDEITNNLDLETRDHVIQVLKAYPGALVVISHDNEFLNTIGIQDQYRIEDGTLIAQDS